MIIRKTIRKILDKIYKPLILSYTKTERRFHYESLDLLVRPGIFHPKFFNSTNNLLNFLHKTDLEGKSLLDLGTGSGILALYAASRGAIVTASDISPQAVNNAVYNSRLNSIGINVILSDLFDNITPQKYEIIVINPPYYPINPRKESDYAWYCGNGFEFYQKLFSQIAAYLQEKSLAVLSFADTCDLDKIQQISERYDFRLDYVEQKKYLWERQFIFRLIKNSTGSTSNN